KTAEGGRVLASIESDPVALEQLESGGMLIAGHIADVATLEIYGLLWSSAEAGELAHVFREEGFVDDRVAAEDGGSLPAADLHCDVLGDAGAHHVAGGGPPEVVDQSARKSRLAARLFPGPREVLDRLTAAMEDVGDHGRRLLLL